MNQTGLTKLITDIVSAHVANNKVAVQEMGNLIQQVHSALLSLGKSPEDGRQLRLPVVSVRASRKQDYIVCLECGIKRKTLKRHLQTAHNMTPAQYRSEYGLSDDYPMSSRNLSETRRTLGQMLKPSRKPSAQGKLPQARPKLSNKI